MFEQGVSVSVGISGVITWGREGEALGRGRDDPRDPDLRRLAENDSQFVYWDFGQTFPRKLWRGDLSDTRTSSQDWGDVPWRSLECFGILVKGDSRFDDGRAVSRA